MGNTMSELGKSHQKFLATYAKPSVHFSYEEAPVAYVQHPDSNITPEIALHASKSWNPDLSRALAITHKALPADVIHELIKNPTVRPTSLTVLMNNKGVNSEHLSALWKKYQTPSLVFGGDNTYAQQKILNHPMVTPEILDSALEHSDSSIRHYAEWQKRARTKS